VIDNAQMEQNDENRLTMREQWSETQIAATAEASMAATAARDECNDLFVVVYIHIALQVDSGKVFLCAPLGSDHSHCGAKVDQSSLPLTGTERRTGVASPLIKFSLTFPRSTKNPVIFMHGVLVTIERCSFCRNNDYFDPRL